MMDVTSDGARGDAVGVPAELQGAIPRDIRLTRAGVVMVAIAASLAVIALAGVILSGVLYVRARHAKDLRERDAVRASARVTSVTVERNEGRRLTVTYVYEADGRAHAGRQRLRESDRRGLRSGDVLAIEFLSSQPETSWVTGYAPGAFPWFVVPFMALSLLLAAIVIGRMVRRQWTLLSEGRFASARVTAATRIKQHEGRSYRVTCAFQALSGAPVTADYQTNRKPPPVGTLVPILYHRDTPRWTAPYPLPFVTPVRARTV